MRWGGGVPGDFKTEVHVVCFRPQEPRFPINIGITGHVARTGEVSVENVELEVCGVTVIVSAGLLSLQNWTPVLLVMSDKIVTLAVPEQQSSGCCVTVQGYTLQGREAAAVGVHHQLHLFQVGNLKFEELVKILYFKIVLCIYCR